MPLNTSRVIPNILQSHNGARGAPPLVAVVIMSCTLQITSRRGYIQEKSSWVTLGNLPERPVSRMAETGIQAGGERLIVIGGPMM